MAKITLDDLERYGNWLDGIAVDAEGSFRSAVLARYGEMRSELGDISGWDRKHVEELRDFATDMIVDVWGTHGDASSSIGSMFFERTLGEDMPETAVMADYVNIEQAAASARYWAKSLFGDDADVDAFVDGCSRFVNRVVSHSADMQTIDQAVEEASKGKRIKYARVPVGPTCGFCIMLASRGFVYATKKSAGDDGGAFNRFHEHCNCRVVAGYDGLEVEGYDYRGMYRRYRQCRDTIGDTEAVWQDWQSLPQEERDSYGRGARAIPLSEDPDEDARLRKKLGAQADAFNDYLAHRVCQEMDTRDREWLYSGKTPSPSFETNELEWEITNNRPHELRTAARLNGHGVPTPFRIDERHFFDEERGVWQTVGLSDLANGYELKTLQDASWSSVDDYLRKTAKKEGVRAVVIDDFENKSSLSDAELIRKLQEQSRWRGSIYVITHDDRYMRVPMKNASEVPLRDQPGRTDSIAHAASSTEEHRSPKPTTGVRPLGGVPGETGSADGPCNAERLLFAFG